MNINYKPSEAWTGDYIPFFWQGEYHLFYLKSFRNIPEHGEGTPWAHLVTPGLVHFKDHGECLTRGSATDQDLYVFTGCTLYGECNFSADLVYIQLGTYTTSGRPLPQRQTRSGSNLFYQE
jgi:beta-fructofuranosidase